MTTAPPPQLGPYKLGDSAIIKCVTVGGSPPPQLNWWREHSLLDGSYETTEAGQVVNSLLLENLQRADLHAILTCQVPVILMVLVIILGWIHIIICRTFSHIEAANLSYIQSPPMIVHIKAKGYKKKLQTSPLHYGRNILSTMCSWFTYFERLLTLKTLQSATRSTTIQGPNIIFHP